jgi:hypothetical protein
VSRQQRTKRLKKIAPEENYSGAVISSCFSLSVMAVLVEHDAVAVQEEENL